MHLTRAFRHAGRIPTTFFFAAALILISSSAHVRAQTAPSQPIGELKTAVILVNFQDNTSQPISRSDAHALVLGTVSDFYWEASYQRTFFSGDTFGWFTVPVSTSNCDTFAIAEEGNRAATAAGANLAAYAQVVYLFPNNTGCTFSGRAAIGPGGQGQVFINGSISSKVIAHELGHVYGLQHADGLDCGVAAIGDNCTRVGYADQADTMGNRGAHFNAFHKERLGWLNAAGAPPITTVASSGRYNVESYETRGQGAKALKIRKGTDPANGQPIWYYLEYRQPVGFDSVLTGVGNLTSGLQVRTGSVSDGVGTSLLLDMTPDSDNSTSNSDVKDGALAVGRSFVDTAAGVTITLVAADANGATVDVSVAGAAPPATCTRAAPTVSLTGPAASVAAGSTVSYTLNLTNRDSSACTATTFNLARSVPSGWTGTLAVGSLSLSPGASSGTTLNVTSASTATAGSHGIGVGASSSVGSAHTANASTTYSVASAPSSGTLTQTLGTDKTSYLRGQTVYMSALVKNNGVAVNGASVKFTVGVPGGGSTIVSVTSGSDGYARSTYKLGKGKAAIGSYALRADVSSGGNTASASASFSVN